MDKPVDNDVYKSVDNNAPLLDLWSARETRLRSMMATPSMVHGSLRRPQVAPFLETDIRGRIIASERLSSPDSPEP
ncbi:hypothetical protein ARTHRO9V_280306 [Arthrobacter sp. 9V]|nr:hypothetical protein ARTHRO9V_280306 [Arthrobacter sp. 9V]